MPPQRLIMAAFFLQPLAYGSWLPRIPEIQHALGLDHASLALALMGMPAGILITLPFAGPLAGRIGARATILWGFVAFLAAVLLPAWSWNLPSLFISLAITGSAMSIIELGLNLKADEIEKTSPKMIMNTCHGFWSLGIMTGSLLAVPFAAMQLSAGLSVVVSVAMLFVPSILVARSLPRDTGEAEDASTRAPRFRLPHPALIGICLFVVGVAMTEGAASDWSAVFLRDIYASGPTQAGIGYSVFALMVSAGRFMGDRLKARFGAVFMARACALVGLCGVGIIFFSGSAVAAISGFALLGMGASLGFPLAVTAAASAPGRASSNVALLSFMALTGFLIGPPIIGYVAQGSDIRFGLAVLAPALLVSALLSGLLTSRRATAESVAAEQPVQI